MSKPGRSNPVLWILLTVLFALLFTVVWALFGKPFFSWLFDEFGVPSPTGRVLLSLLRWIFLLEIVAKLLLIVAAKPKDFVPAQVESLTVQDRSELERYTAELEALGFVRLTDYTIDSTEAIARLFSHPREFCFAEIGRAGNLPTFCSMSCHLEQRWLLATTNQNALSAISYAFFRQPRTLVKQLDGSSADALLRSLLEWREQVSADLNIEILPHHTADIYFERERRLSVRRQKSIARKSVVWALIEMLYFSCNPQLEWLGEYAKFKRGRRPAA